MSGMVLSLYTPLAVQFRAMSPCSSRKSESIGVYFSGTSARSESMAMLFVATFMSSPMSPLSRICAEPSSVRAMLLSVSCACLSCASSMSILSASGISSARLTRLASVSLPMTNVVAGSLPFSLPSMWLSRMVRSACMAVLSMDTAIFDESFSERRSPGTSIEAAMSASAFCRLPSNVRLSPVADASIPLCASAYRAFMFSSLTPFIWSMSNNGDDVVSLSSSVSFSPVGRTMS